MNLPLAAVIMVHTHEAVLSGVLHLLDQGKQNISSQEPATTNIDIWWVTYMPVVRMTLVVSLLSSCMRDSSSPNHPSSVGRGRWTLEGYIQGQQDMWEGERTPSYTSEGRWGWWSLHKCVGLPHKCMCVLGWVHACVHACVFMHAHMCIQTHIWYSTCGRLSRS